MRTHASVPLPICPLCFPRLAAVAIDEKPHASSCHSRPLRQTLRECGAWCTQATTPTTNWRYRVARRQSTHSACRSSSRACGSMCPRTSTLSRTHTRRSSALWSPSARTSRAVTSAATLRTQHPHRQPAVWGAHEAAIAHLTPCTSLRALGEVRGVCPDEGSHVNQPCRREPVASRRHRLNSIATNL